MRQKNRSIKFLIFLVALVFGVVLAGVGSRAENLWSGFLNSSLLAAKEKEPSAILPLDTVRSKLTFVIDSLCVITDPTNSLAHFFNELEMLRNHNDTVISIVHLGDSHIQAGHFSGKMMRLMQGQYGNAGRGWIAPFKISKSNEPDDYFLSSLVKDWTAGRCIQTNKKTPIGPGGIGIHTVSPFVNFDIVMTPLNGAGYEFNEAILFRGDKSMPMLPAGSLRDSVTVYPDSVMLVSGIVTDTFRINCLTDTLQLQSTRRKPGTDELYLDSHFTNMYYGFVLTNGAPGILYHSIGVNGAMYSHYTDSEYIKKLSLLRPSLLIISLGTNETFAGKFTADGFSEQVEDFILLIKKYLPETAILLTTPPECYKRVTVNKRRTYARNEQTATAARIITEQAKKHDLACWDLFSATGGRHSNSKWYSGQWMGNDRVHFNKEGYREQGVLLFKALHASR